MDSGNFHTFHGIVNFQGNHQDLNYDVTLDGIAIGKARLAEDGNIYYNHSINDKNFLTAVADSFGDAAQDLASFAFKTGVIR